MREKMTNRVNSIGMQSLAQRPVDRMPEVPSQHAPLQAKVPARAVEHRATDAGQDCEAGDLYEGVAILGYN